MKLQQTYLNNYKQRITIVICTNASNKLMQLQKLESYWGVISKIIEEPFR